MRGRSELAVTVAVTKGRSSALNVLHRLRGRRGDTGDRGRLRSPEQLRCLPCPVGDVWVNRVGTDREHTPGGVSRDSLRCLDEWKQPS